MAFPGVAPAVILISPNPIPGNITIPVSACITDALGSPLSGVVFDFSFENMGVGSGTLDGISSAGTVPQATDASGCVNTIVTTTGVAASSGGGGGTNSPDLRFTVGTTTASAPITAGGGLILLAKPSALGGNGGTVQLTLLNSNGTPVPGVQLQGACTGPTVGLSIPPGVTNSAGQTTTTITADLNEPNGGGGTGSCVFTTATGSPTVTVNITGVDPCTVASSTSPLPGCTAPSPSTVTITINSAGSADNASLTGIPGLSCSLASGNATVSCTSSTVNGGNYTLTATTSVAGAITWSGSCVPSGTVGPNTSHATMTVPTTATSLTCTANVP